MHICEMYPPTFTIVLDKKLARNLVFCQMYQDLGKKNNKRGSRPQVTDRLTVLFPFLGKQKYFKME